MRWLKVLDLSLKTLAYALCALGCFYQCVSLLNLYFSFPSTVTSTVEIMDKLQLPAMTICNNNRIMLSKLKEFDPQFARFWDELIEQIRKKQHVSRAKVNVQKLLDETVRNLMDNLSVNAFAQLGHRWTDLIPAEHFKCATDAFNLDNKCLKYANIIESAQEEGNCFTIFSRSENSDFLKNIAIKSGLSQSAVIHGRGKDGLNLEISEQPFHPNELFRMLVNFSVHDYTTVNDKVIGQIVVHDENEIPAIRQRNFLIYPGNYYEFYVNKEIDKYLPLPYETDCFRYDVLRDAGENGTKKASAMSRESCITECMAQGTVQLCGCWPPELPYILGNSTEHSLKWCSWRDGVNVQANETSLNGTNWFRFCFSSHEKECNQQCKVQCEVDRYTVLRQSFTWPSNERMEHSAKYNSEFRKCCAIVSLGFWSSEQTTVKYEPKFAFVEFSSYFGGLLSVWLGFSLVKTYDIAEMVIRKIVGRWRKRMARRAAMAKEKESKQSSDVSAAAGGGVSEAEKKSSPNRPRVAKYYKTKHVHTSSI